MIVKSMHRLMILHSRDPLRKNDECEREFTVLLEKPGYCYAVKSFTELMKKSLYLGYITEVKNSKLLKLLN